MVSTNQFAYLIGVQDYHSLPSLSTPLNDIRNIGNLLEADFGYEVTYCQNPTLTELRGYLGDITEKFTRNLVITNGEPISILIYFAGHGVANDSSTGIKGFLLPADAKRNLASSWFSMDELVLTLEALPCTHTLIMLDCCFSGAIKWASKHRDIGFTGEEFYRQHYEYFRNRRSFQVLTSTAPDQLALDFVRQEAKSANSPFAECLIEGLKGDADTIPDKIITVAELFAYLQSHLINVSRKYGNPQNVGLFPLERHDSGEYLFCMAGFLPQNLRVQEYENPYRGLKSYDAEHWNRFFGRKQAIESLLSVVKNHPLTVVLGASGTGKSSLVKAGIIPRLPGGKDGRIPVIKPGLNPLTEIPNISTFDIIVIDQFEQLITLVDEIEAIAFLEEIYLLIEKGKQVIITLRIDYEARLPNVPSLKPYWNRFIIPPFTAEELREVIVTPAFRQGRFIVPMTLVDRIIEEVIHYPGSLPLLSFTMQQLFERCQNHPYQNITPEDYHSLGGVIGSLQKKADDVYVSFPNDASRNTMRCLILRMVSLTGGQVASRRILLDELHFGNADENLRMETVKHRMLEERLVLVGRDPTGKEFIEPVHDALVNTWAKVQLWIKLLGDANLLLYNELQAAVNKYQREERSSSYLWHTNFSLNQLLNAQKSEVHQLTLNLEETNFVAKSKQKKQLNTIRTWAMVVLVILGLSGLSWFGFDQAKKAVASALEAIKEKNNAQESQKLAEKERSNAEMQQKIAEMERDKAQIAQEKAESETRSASNVSLVLRTVNSDPTLALRMAEYNLQHHPEDAATYSIFHDIISDTSKLFYRQRISENILPTDFSYIFSSAFSPDGKLIITGHFDHKARLWSRNGQLLRVFDYHQEPVTSVKFSADGSKILTGSVDKKAILWATNGQIIDSLVGHSRKITDVSFSPDSKYILTGSIDKTIKLWSSDGDLLHTISLPGAVNAVTFSPDNKVILAGCEDKTARCFSLKGDSINVLTGHQNSITSVAFSSDGKFILTGSEDWTAKLWTSSGNLIRTLDAHKDHVSSVAFTPDSKYILTGSWDWTAKVWSLDGIVLKTLIGHTSTIEEISTNFDGKNIITCSNDGSVRVWAFNSLLITTLKEHKGGVSSACFAPDGTSFLTGSNDSFLRIWSKNGNLLKTFTGHKGSITSATYSQDGKWILTGSKDKTARLWSLEGNTIEIFSGHLAAVNTVAISADGKFIVSGSQDKTIKLWSDKGKLIRSFNASSSVHKVAFTPNGKGILYCSRNKVTMLTLTGEVITEYVGPSNVINDFAISPDGKMIIAGASDETITLWGLTGNILTTFRGDESSVNSVRFSPNGQFVISGGYDNTAKYWDLKGHLICSLKGHNRGIHSVAIAPDGQSVITGSDDGTARVWMLPEAFLRKKVNYFINEELSMYGVKLESQ